MITRSMKCAAVGVMVVSFASVAEAGWLDAVNKTLKVTEVVTGQQPAKPAAVSAVETKVAEVKAVTSEAEAKKDPAVALPKDEGEVSSDEPIPFSMHKLASRLRNTSGYLLLDVRSPGEFASGHIKGAVNVPVGTVSRKIGRVASGKGQVIYVYCLSGSRSATAAQELVDAGYRRVYDCGGLNDWPGKLVH